MRRTALFCFAIVLVLNFNSSAKAVSSKISPGSIDLLNRKAYNELHSNMVNALAMLIVAEQQCLKTGYTKGLAENYLYQGEVYNQKGYVKRALTYFNRAANLSLQEHDAYNKARADELISSIERRNGHFAVADKLLKSSFETFKRLDKTVDIANIQLRIGVLLIKQKKYKEAMAMFQNSYLTSKKINYLFGEKKSYYNKAELFNDINNADSAIYYYHKALKIDTITKDNYGKALSYIGLSKYYFKTNQFNKAIQYANTAELNANSVNATLLSEEAIEVLLNIATKQNDLASIAHWQERLLQIEREINETNKNDAAQFIDVLKQQQERQLAIQKQFSKMQKISETKSIILLCFFVITLIVVMFILSVSYNYKKTKAYAADLNEKKRMLEEHANSVAMLNEKVTGQNEILEEDNRLKSKLLSVISHDLRHPLTNTKSIIDLVNLKLVSHEEAETLFAQLEAQYVRALTLLDNLLYWIKSQVHGDTVQKVDINVKQLINSLIEEQKLMLQKKNINAENLVDADITWYAESELVKIIFRNLLTNAIKFTHHDGLIQFISVVTDTETKVSVKDNGIGMNNETLTRVCLESQHYTSKGTANEEGSGLGLMLIRDLIRKINGSLNIESEAGKGSTFTVSVVTVEEPHLQED